METGLIVIVIRAESPSDSAGAFVQPLLLPYLAKLAGDARLVADRIQRKLTGKDARGWSRIFEVELTGESPLDLDDLAGKLERFLKLATRHADLPLALEIFRIENMDDKHKVGSHASS